MVLNCGCSCSYALNLYDAVKCGQMRLMVVRHGGDDACENSL